jgi:hypothetical protein
MRAFFVTAGMFAGKDALWITDRSGHTSLGMLRTYERDVRRWRELGETPVEADVAIPELAAANTAANAAAEPQSVKRPSKATSEKCTGRESNPSKWHFVSRRCRSSFVARVRESCGFLAKAEVLSSPRQSHTIDPVLGEILETGATLPKVDVEGSNPFSRSENDESRCFSLAS